jgi:Mg/Co/Ni transporter MgtE
MIESLPYLHAAELLTLTEDRVAADALEIMAPERQLQVFEEIEPAHGARLLTHMAPDLAADLVGRLEPTGVQRYLDLMPEPARVLVVALLRYPADSAGGIMTNDVLTVPAGVTVGKALELLRGPLQSPDFIYYVYVVGGAEHWQLLGVITLRDLLIAEDAAPVEQVMQRELLTIHPLESADAAARRVIDAHLVALPVTDERGRLLGAVTFDAAMVQLAPAPLRDQAPRVFS